MERFFAVIIAAALLFCGCQSKSASSSELPAVISGPTITGRVTYVSGNDFTLALGEYEGGSGGKADTSDSKQEAPPADITAGTADGENASPASDKSGGEAMTEPSSDSQSGRGDKAPQGGGAGASGMGASPAGTAAAGKFTENGKELKIRIPVGTAILYGTLNVDFSQIQTDYIISVSYHPTDSGSDVLVLSAEILST